jgi:hypothetical protein
MDNDWPELNGLAWLRLPCCGAEHPTRVEDMIGELCVVAAPVAPHQNPVTPPSGDQGFFIGWVGNRQSAVEAPVVLTEHAAEPIATWTLRSVGDPVETQRRNYVRLPYSTEVSLYLIDRGAPVKAQTLDISEGGIRVQLDKWANDPGGRLFMVEMPFEGHTFSLRAQIAWWGNLNDNDVRVAGLRFHEIEEVTANNIRKHIFAAQLEERRRRNT